MENKKKTKTKNILTPFYNEESDTLEIGIDEAGRGPMFGRVYCAAVILPKNENFKFELLKDSKKFSSTKKIIEVADYIKNNALAYNINFSDEKTIDNINIRNATLNTMHKCIEIITNNNTEKVKNNTKYNKKSENYYLLVDGNDFKPYTYINKDSSLEQISHILVEGGDNKYCSIAAASILAKVERDKYIKEICECYSKLDIYYNLLSNKGYGTAKHMEGIKKYGISPWHRTSYGCCKTATLNNDDFYL
tara:strand:- start:823 stop:1569 length:747 start_codon:yes stop_codon:yes gene_type:complete